MVKFLMQCKICIVIEIRSSRPITPLVHTVPSLELAQGICTETIEVTKILLAGFMFLHVFVYKFL